MFDLINVYGPNNIEDLREVWNVLSDVFQIKKEKFFILGGDFNAILILTEK